MKLTPIVALKTLVCLSAIAPGLTAYELETSLSYRDQEGDSDPTYSLDLRYFLTPIQHNSVTPWDEIPFVERVSHFDLGIQYSDTDSTLELDLGPFSPIVLDEPIFLTTSFKKEVYSSSYTHRDRNSSHSFSTGFEYEKLKTTLPRVSISQSFSRDPFTGLPILPLNTNVDISYSTSSQKAGSVFAGYDYYIDDNWTIGSDVEYADRSGFDGLTWSVDTKRLWSLGTNRWFGIESRIGFMNREGFGQRMEDWLFQLTGQYYFNAKTAVNAEIETVDGTAFETYSLGLSHYLNDFLYVRVVGSTTQIDIPSGLPPEAIVQFDDSVSAIRIQFGGRF